jgi:hypothetical protein
MEVLKSHLKYIGEVISKENPSESVFRFAESASSAIYSGTKNPHLKYIEEVISGKNPCPSVFLL